MFKIINQMRVMETETIQKNGASSKSLMSRGNFKNLLTAATIILFCMETFAQTLTITSPSYGTTYRCGDWVDIFVSGYTGNDWQEFLELEYTCLTGEPQPTNNDEPGICKFIAYPRAEAAYSFTFSPETPAVWEGRWVKLIAHNKKNDTWSAPQYVRISSSSFDETVNVTTPGTLCTVIGEQKFNITSLKVIGNLNGADILCIREMAGSNASGGSTDGKLETLNLKDANIIASSGTINQYYSGNTTSNNIIGNYMFYNCSKLTNITLPSSVTSIGSNAFQNSGLIGISIPNSVNEIGNSAFSGCSNLQSFVIEDKTVALTLGTTLFTSTLIETLYLGRNINRDVFRENAALKSVTIGNEVNTINANSFYNCIGLQLLMLGNGLITISDYAFYGCSNLTSAINIPNKVKTIGYWAFQGCKSIPSVTIPNSVNEIGRLAFSGCNNLKNVTIEDGTVKLTCHYGDQFTNTPVETLFLGRDITSNASVTFSENAALKSVTIGNFVTIINSSVFLNCIGLQTLTLGNELITISDYAFYGCSNLTSAINIPNKVKTIGYWAFQGCKSIPSVTIPNSVTEIGRLAFSGCNNLKNVTIEDGTVTLTCHYGDQFTNTPVETLFLGRNITSTASVTFRDNPALKTVTIGNFVTIINSSVFYNCIGLQTLTLGNELTEIGNDAFHGCSSLESTLIVPNKVKTIGSGAFQDCKSLPSVTIPNLVETLGNSAFSGCTNLKTVDIKDKTVYLNCGTNLFSNAPIETLYLGRDINRDVFRGNDALKSVTIGNDVTTIVANCFYNCIGLKTLTLGNELTTISDNAFYGCSSLEGALVLPNKVNTVGSGAFQGCRSLLSVTIPNSVGSFGNNTFSGCTSLKTVTIADKPVPLTFGNNLFSNAPIETLYLGREINRDVFRENAALKSVTVGNDVTTIVANCFFNCIGLTSAIIGSSVKTIGGAAFSGCTGLSQITSYPTTPPAIQSNTFNGVNRGIPVFIDCACLNTYQTQNYWRDFTNYQCGTPKSNDATLQILTVSVGTLAPVFNANTTNYTVNVANSVTSITLTATKNDNGATVNGDGTKTLNVGENRFDIVVTAEDGTTKKTYTVVINRAGADTYSITVQNDGNGTANANVASASAGTEITLTATPNTGYKFKEWQVVSGGVTITGNKFIMPSVSVTVKAIFEEISVTPTTYLVTVTGGTGGGNFEAGATVSITANAAPAGHEFDKWTASDGVTFANANSATTTFTMPAKAVTVTATYKTITSAEITDVLLARIYPNPTDGTITLRFESEGVYHLTLTDMTGRILLQKTVSDKITQLDISAYPSGVYLLTIDDGKRQSAMRVAKE